MTDIVDPYLCQRQGWLQLGAFTSCFYLLRGRFLPKFLDAFWRSWDVKRRNVFANHLVSGIHAVFASALVISTFITYPELVGDLQGVHAGAKALNQARFALAFSTGYFIADCLDMALNGVYAGNFGIWAHHVVALACYVSGLHHCLLYPYLVLTLLVELNSLFIHTRKLLLLTYNSSISSMPVPHLALYKTATTWMKLTFVPTRMLANFYISYRLVMDRREGWAAPIWTWWLAMFGMAGVNYYNFVLWNQVKASVRRDEAKSAPPSPAGSKGKGGGGKTNKKTDEPVLTAQQAEANDFLG
ncbi:TLC domain-containing protein [Phlyctochytrium arcticum]|nr:TLC domain-containing protein [Phlyctochytrium arcticum]